MMAGGMDGGQARPVQMMVLKAALAGKGKNKGKGPAKNKKMSKGKMKAKMPPKGKMMMDESC